jgi:hypothetical protein
MHKKNQNDILGISGCEERKLYFAHSTGAGCCNGQDGCHAWGPGGCFTPFTPLTLGLPGILHVPRHGKVCEERVAREESLRGEAGGMNFVF